MNLIGYHIGGDMPYLYIGTWLTIMQVPDDGATGAQEIFSHALGLLDAIDVLGYIKAVIYLLLVLFATMTIFRVLGGQK